ncbi:hypothetical protein [Polaromonas sp. YR568]|uniref:hypothetical protein n=1 Tax=Polaromonas sp. YR568 TaxID=1855301 RepID=UPI0020C92E5E|nr:hypothetical protein [Polaromonas sp. YR568]
MTRRTLTVLVLASATVLTALPARTADLPADLKNLVGTPVPAPGAIETANVLTLNKSMFELYDDAAAVFRQNILANHPVILAQFSGAGGAFTLYRPGQPMLEAPSVPITYQLLKSVGHSTMALAQVVGPYLDNPKDKSWLPAMVAFRGRMQMALDSVDATAMPPAWRENNHIILKANLAFMDECIKTGNISYGTLEAFSRKQAPYLAQNVTWAAQMQVNHWMNVLTEWKALLGNDWNKTYGMSNSIYVTRQNNVIFSVLAQFFGAEAINDRLILVETMSFTTTRADMLGSLTRIIADRSVGKLFFGNYYLMDYELMGGDARDAIIAETAKRNMAAVLPPVVPFGSRQWPTLVTPGPGPGSIKDLLR